MTCSKMSQFLTFSRISCIMRKNISFVDTIERLTGKERLMSDYSKEVNKCLIGVKKGKTDCFDKLFNLTANHMRCLAFKYLGNKSFVDDVVSETFMRVYKYIHTYDGKISGLGWMYRIVRNVCMDFNKNENSERDIIAAETAAALDFEENTDMESKIDLFAAMDGLDELDREILRLRFYEDLTLENIGKEVGISKVSVFKKLKQILADMNKRL